MLQFNGLLVFILLGAQSLSGQVQERKNLDYKNATYDVFTVKIDTSITNNFSIAENKNHLVEDSFFNNIAGAHQHFFAITASIVDSSCAPLGLYINNGTKIKGPNLGKGAGNFYLMPNGFFAIEPGGAKIADATSYNSTNSYRIAIQSGPMLVINRAINSNFSKSSKNLNIRCAVGAFIDKNDQYLVFVKSVKPVSFYQVAELLLDKFKCNDAINLEGGSNCSMHLPNTPTQQRNDIAICNYIMLLL